MAIDDVRDHWTAIAARHRAPSRATAAATLSPRQRCAIALAVVLVHLLALLADRSDDAPPQPARDAIRVVFIEDRPASSSAPPPPWPVAGVRAARTAGAGPHASPAPQLQLQQERTLLAVDSAEPEATQAAAAPTTAPRAALFRNDGALALPAGVLDDLEAVLADDRRFDYRTPGLDDAQRLFERAPAIDYRSTRFAAGWIEEKDILSSALDTAFKATSVEVKAGRRMTCVASLLGGVGCSWGRVRHVEPADDPTTLDRDEAAHCQAVWDRIVAATGHAAWRALRDEYEADCRKPLAPERVAD